MDERRAEAAAYLGITDPAQAASLPQRIVDAVTTDDLGAVPPALIEAPGWDRLSDHDRTEAVRFAALLRAMGSGHDQDA